MGMVVKDQDLGTRINCLFVLVALGLHCFVWVISSCGEPGLLFLAVYGLLTAVVSLVAEHRL